MRKTRGGKRKETSDAIEQDTVDVRAVERSPSISLDSSDEDEEVDLAIDSGSESSDQSEETRHSEGAEGEDEEDKPRRKWSSVMDEEDSEDDEAEGTSDEDDSEDEEDDDEAGLGTDDDEAVGAGEEDLASDSSEEERENVNTIGESIPLKWYEHERHIGYDKDGKRIEKQANAKASTMDFFLDKQDGKLGSKSNKVWDEYNQRIVELTKDEMRAIRRIRKGMFPHLSVDPFPDLQPWATKDKLTEPMVDLPEPKARFLPSKWEAAKVVKLVRAMRKGWIKPPSELEKERKEKEEEEQKLYMLWSDDNRDASLKAANGLSYVPATKVKLPGHAGSYNPPKEYLQEEGEENEDDAEMGYQTNKAFDCLRRVPAYDKFVNEQFERCLDLYLCPRMRSRKGNRTAENLHKKMAEQKAKLPKPSELRPYPRKLALEYPHSEQGGQQVKVNCLCVDPTGQYLCTGASDGHVRVFEVGNARLVRQWRLHPGKTENNKEITCVAWSPTKSKDLILAVAGQEVFVVSALAKGKIPDRENRPTLGQAAISASIRALKEGEAPNPKALWSKSSVSETLKGGSDCDALSVRANKKITRCAWHHKGDYFVSVCPSGNNMSVLVHQISKCATQTPFNKTKGGKVVTARFHPSKPILFVASENHVRAFHLVKQELVAKLVCGSGAIISMALHPLGDNLLVGTTANRVEWFDLDLSGKAYKVIRNHKGVVQDVNFSGNFPLFASASDDGEVHVFHGRVFSDFETNPLIVPVKILKETHAITDQTGVMACSFHPHQPWLITAGADGRARLFVN